MARMGKRLKGYTVLVSRPYNQAVSLGAKIEDEGGVAILAPMIGIRSISEHQRSAALINRLEEYASVIFISRNAVKFGTEKIRAQSKDLSHVSLYAVGVGSAAELQDRGFSNVQTPLGEFTSEGLLQHDGLQARAIANAKILIIRGAGGREHLRETLISRGAEVDYCEVYERFVPDICLADTISQAGATVPDIAIVTSIEGVTNFADKIADEGLEQLFDMPLLVVGSRIANEVTQLGFTNPPVIVDNPSDGHVIDALARWVMDEL